MESKPPNGTAVVPQRSDSFEQAVLMASLQRWRRAVQGRAASPSCQRATHAPASLIILLPTKLPARILV